MFPDLRIMSISDLLPQPDRRPFPRAAEIRIRVKRTVNPKGA